MARQLSTNPITEKDIVDYLKTNDDFHLELQVYNACVRAGLRVFLGGTYEDPATKLSRQFDIRAKVLKWPLEIRLAVECKCLKPNFPLVVSRVPRQLIESYHDIIVSSSEPQVLRLGGEHSIYPEGQYVGKSTTQIGRHATSGDLISGDSEVYDKWSQALASSHGLIYGSAGAHRKLGKTHLLVAIIPIVVIPDGTLWIVDYDFNGKQQGDPKLTDNALVYVGRQYPVPMRDVQFSISHLQFFTLSEFCRFLEQLNQSAIYWNGLFPMQQIQAELNKAQLGLRSA